MYLLCLYVTPMPMSPMLHSLHWQTFEKRIKYKSLIKPPHVLQTIFTFTLLPSSSTVLQTPEHSEYHPSTLGPVVSTLSLTMRLQPPRANSLFLPGMLPLLVLSDLPGKLSFRNLFFSPITLGYESERERESKCVCLCVCRVRGCLESLLSVYVCSRGPVWVRHYLNYYCYCYYCIALSAT